MLEDNGDMSEDNWGALEDAWDMLEDARDMVDDVWEVLEDPWDLMEEVWAVSDLLVVDFWWTPQRSLRIWWRTGLQDCQSCFLTFDKPPCSLRGIWWTGGHSCSGSYGEEVLVQEVCRWSSLRRCDVVGVPAETHQVCPRCGNASWIGARDNYSRPQGDRRPHYLWTTRNHVCWRLNQDLVTIIQINLWALSICWGPWRTP